MKNITDRVKSYEDACKELGENPIIDWGNATKDEIAYKKLKTIIKALNEGWGADYKDSDQCKWIPWFHVSSSGFAFGATNYDYSSPYAGGAARLCLENSELAKYAGETFLTIWEDFIV